MYRNVHNNLKLQPDTPSHDVRAGQFESVKSPLPRSPAATAANSPPSRPPDAVREAATTVDQAALYRCAGREAAHTALAGRSVHRQVSRVHLPTRVCLPACLSDRIAASSSRLCTLRLPGLTTGRHHCMAPGGDCCPSLSPPSFLLPSLPARLSGDYNPLHIDPEVSRRVGFERPILHGLCSMGVSVRQVLHVFGGDDPASIRSIKVRVTRVAWPAVHTGSAACADWLLL